MWIKSLDSFPLCRPRNSSSRSPSAGTVIYARCPPSARPWIPVKAKLIRFYLLLASIPSLKSSPVAPMSCLLDHKPLFPHCAWSKQSSTAALLHAFILSFKLSSTTGTYNLFHTVSHTVHHIVSSTASKGTSEMSQFCRNQPAFVVSTRTRSVPDSVCSREP